MIKIQDLCQSFLEEFNLKSYCGRRGRSIISSSIGELIVTGLGYPLLLGSDKRLFSLMISAYLFKVAYSIIAAFPAKLLVFLMRYIDGEHQIHPFNTEFRSAQNFDRVHQ